MGCKGIKASLEKPQGQQYMRSLNHSHKTGAGKPKVSKTKTQTRGKVVAGLYMVGRKAEIRANRSSFYHPESRPEE